MCICLMEISIHLAVLNLQCRQRRGGFEGEEGNEVDGDSPGKDILTTEGGEITQ